jgi:hypothetical protein
LEDLSFVVSGAVLEGRSLSKSDSILENRSLFLSDAELEERSLLTSDTDLEDLSSCALADPLGVVGSDSTMVILSAGKLNMSLLPLRL